MESLVQSALARKINEEKTVCDEDESEKLRLVVLGTGGGGNNTVNRLSRMGVCGAELIAANTDAQDLKKLDESITKILMGPKITRGLGAGGFPEIGGKTAEASRRELEEVLAGTHMLFLCAGMGGGTGTGSAPVIAEIAKDLGAIVIAIVTFPFSLERSRLSKARAGISNLRKKADTVVVVDNNKLVEYVPNVPIDQAFLVADEIVSRAVKGIVDTIMEPSLINLDFADIKSVLGGGKIAMISVGEGSGPDRVQKAVENNLKHPLLDVNYKGATGALIHITGGENMTIGEANKVGEELTKGFNPSAGVTWGARVDPSYNDKIEVISIVNGVQSANMLGGIEDYSGKDVNVYSREAEELDIRMI
ncbi:MAG: cell division protein FtsZ [Candidatus Altiarchaeota archaeon]